MAIVGRHSLRAIWQLTRHIDKSLFGIVLIGAFLGIGAYIFLYGIEPGEFDHYPQRILAPAPPVQEHLPQAQNFSFRGYNLELTHRYNLNAVVLSQRYYDDDREADLANIDLAVGWGPMSHPETLNSIKVAQANRYYFFRSDHKTLPHTMIVRNSANIHVIPQNAEIYRKILNAQRGRMILISGYLVNATSAKGDWVWQSSLSRTDVGHGACELVLVDYVEVVDPV